MGDGVVGAPGFPGPGHGGRSYGSRYREARAEGKHRFMHAYPTIHNLPSNAICRKLGFELVGELPFEYPPGRGNLLRCNDRRLDLGD